MAIGGIDADHAVEGLLVGVVVRHFAARGWQVLVCVCVGMGWFDSVRDSCERECTSVRT